MLLLVAIRKVEIAAEAGDDRQGEAAAVAPRGGIAAREDREFVRVVLHDRATSGSFRIASRAADGAPPVPTKACNASNSMLSRRRSGPVSSRHPPNLSICRRC